MTESDTEGFLSDVKDDKRVTVTVEDSRETYFDDPPTKLKNPRIFKPFELFISMYGTPAHNEMDPTIFIAITYTLMFGAMFGDAGQGLVLFIGGGILYLIRKMKLAGIISLAGVCSIFFGFMYGSFFGFENILHPIWLRPVDAMTKLPFIGQLNSVFVIAVAFGMGLNILVMLFNIVNAIKAKDLGTLLFSNNGLAGIIFYGFIVLTIVLFMTGHKVPGNILMIVFLGIPIILFFLKEPLTNAITHNHKKIEGGKGMFAVSGFFELFETMLSYFSNTLSYVRIGAFAVSHAAIMQVVLMLSGAEAGHANMIGVIVGNIIVMGLEGLVVGIQVLRLEYYELFSRFYKGNGREFVPFKTGDNKKSK
jgi:V/A-type H+-transporting ATPase subunit I